MNAATRRLNSVLGTTFGVVLLITLPLHSFAQRDKKAWNPASNFSGGFYFGLDLGGAVVSGQRGIETKPSTYCISSNSECTEDAVRTDAAAGVATAIRIGFNFVGYAALETYILGAGNKSSGGGKWEGQGHWGFLIRIFPLQIASAFQGKFAKTMRSRFYDFNLYGGGGLFSFLGYHRSSKFDPQTEGKGWSGYHYISGLAVDFAVSKGITVGTDLRLLWPRYNTYILDWDNDEREVKTIPDTLVFMPTVRMTFHFLH